MGTTISSFGLGEVIVSLGGFDDGRGDDGKATMTSTVSYVQVGGTQQAGWNGVGFEGGAVGRGVVGRPKAFGVLVILFYFVWSTLEGFYIYSNDPPSKKLQRNIL